MTGANEADREPASVHSSVAVVRETVQRLLGQGGCAWHAAQTHESLLPFLIEETAEFIDAVEHGLSAGQVAAELGDVLYQVLLHAAIAERDGEGYDFDAVAERLHAKLIARHPHVFGDLGDLSLAQLQQQWEHLKEAASGEPRGSRGVLQGIPAGMPTLARAAKVVQRLRRAHLLPMQAAGMLVDGSVPLRGDGESSAACTEQQLGDALLALVLRAADDGVDPDRALRLATERFASERLGSAHGGYSSGSLGSSGA